MIFSSVYMVYQTPDLDAFINHAHNEYLQWLVEGGLPMLIIIGYGLYRYALQWHVIWIREQWGGFRFIQVGAGIGVLLVILHSTLDFALHKPANSVYFAFFLAIFFKHNQREEQYLLRMEGRPEQYNGKREYLYWKRGRSF